MVSKQKQLSLQLYSDMNPIKEILFWEDVLNIPREQFTKPYIKKSSRVNISHKGGFGHGTCGVIIGDARLSEKVFMAIKAISSYSNQLRV